MRYNISVLNTNAKGGMIMSKTYKHVDHQATVSVHEIERMYDGYWVYLLNVELTEANEILSGIPAVIGTRSSDGAMDGIYDKYKSDEYAPRAGISLLPNRFFISALRQSVGGASS